MKWLVLAYSLPAQLNTSSRVRIWRKIRKTGAISPKNGVYVLPHTEECTEALRWLVSDITQEQGEALVMQVDHFANLPHGKVVDIFRDQRLNDYQKIESSLTHLEQLIQTTAPPNAHHHDDKVIAFNREIKKIRKAIDDIAKVDFFSAFDNRSLLDRLYGLKQKLVTAQLILVMLLSVGFQQAFNVNHLLEECCYLETLEEEEPKLLHGWVGYAL